MKLWFVQDNGTPRKRKGKDIPGIYPSRIGIRQKNKKNLNFTLTILHNVYMQNINLSSGEIFQLKIAHRTARKKRDADRIKAIVLLGKGWTFNQVAEVLLMDEETIQNHLKRYKENGIKGLLIEMNFLHY